MIVRTWDAYGRLASRVASGGEEPSWFRRWLFDDYSFLLRHFEHAYGGDFLCPNDVDIHHQSCNTSWTWDANGRRSAEAWRRPVDEPPGAYETVDETCFDNGQAASRVTETWAEATLLWRLRQTWNRSGQPLLRELDGSDGDEAAFGAADGVVDERETWTYRPDDGAPLSHARDGGGAWGAADGRVDERLRARARIAP